MENRQAKKLNIFYAGLSNNIFMALKKASPLQRVKCGIVSSEMG
jgi:hypothetical protein